MRLALALLGVLLATAIAAPSAVAEELDLQPILDEVGPDPPTQGCRPTCRVSEGPIGSFLPGPPPPPGPGPGG